MKFQIVTRMKSEIEVVELANVRQLKVAMLEACGLCQATAERVLNFHGVGKRSLIVATKLDGIFAGAMWIGERGQEAAFFGFYDRRSKVTRVLESEFEKRCAAKQYALVG